MKPCTASVRSKFLISCLLRLPDMLRHVSGIRSSVGATPPASLAGPMMRGPCEPASPALGRFWSDGGGHDSGVYR